MEDRAAATVGQVMHRQARAPLDHRKGLRDRVETDAITRCRRSVVRLITRLEDSLALVVIQLSHTDPVLVDDAHVEPARDEVTGVWGGGYG